METEIIKHQELKPVPFTGGLVKLEAQTELVLKLLSNAIKEDRPITKEDIIDCYLDFIFYGDRKTVYRSGLDSSKWGGHNGVFTREELKTDRQWYCERLSMNWFRLHLGSAILKGKLLAIPIIEI